MAGARVTFYVLADADERARRTYACRLVEKAYLQDHKVLVRLDTPDDVRDFDELLWRFSDRSFVPHETCPPAGVLSRTRMGSAACPGRTSMVQWQQMRLCQEGGRCAGTQSSFVPGFFCSSR